VSASDALRVMLKTGAISPTVAQAGLDTIDSESAEVLSSAARPQRKNGAGITRVIPKSAQLYRAAVRALNATLTETSERQEARELVTELLGGQAKVRKELGRRLRAFGTGCERIARGSGKLKQKQRLPIW
jgi:hypothetical protein